MGDERSEKKAVKDKIREGINRDMRPADAMQSNYLQMSNMRKTQKLFPPIFGY